MDNLQRIEMRYFEYCPESAYIHKYYLPKALYKEVTRQDVDVLSYHVPGRDGELPDLVQPMMSEGVVISYKDIGCEKFLSGRHITAVFDAVKEHDEDCRASLSDEELRSAILLNKRLGSLEEKIKKELIVLNKTLQGRLVKGDEFLKDYEIGVKVTYYMDHNHPEYYEDDVYHDTEIMGFFKGFGKHVTEEEVSKKDYSGLGGRKDYNELRPKNSDNPFLGMRLCYLFHWYEYSPMPLKHITRIGNIFTDIKVYHQNSFSFKDALQAHIKRRRE